MRSEVEEVGRGQTRQAPVGLVKEFGLYAKGFGPRAGLTSVCFEKIHLAARWGDRLEGRRILASRETQ